MYHPPDGEQYEFVELAAIAGGDCSGMSLAGGVAFRFPEGVVLETGARVLLAADPEALRRRYDAYAAMRDATIFAYAGNLSNGGEELALFDAAGALIERMAYDDDPPWDLLADGFGAALARACFGADAALPENWEARTPTPAEAGGEHCPPVPRPPPAVVINEIMYHPNGDGVDERLYEFVELHNRTDAAVALAGWRLAGDAAFAFALEQVLAPRDYLVVAARPALLLAAYPGLSAAKVAGPFDGTLDNGGGKVALIDAGGAGVDSASYDDDFPWPIAADGYGTTPGRGASLERACADAHASLVANWLASPPDGATPGAANTRVTCDLPLCVLSLETSPAAPGAPIEVVAHLSRPVAAADLRLAYFAKRRHSDLFNPEAVDFTAEDDHYVAALPAFEADTWVRWRIELLAEDDWTSLAPRAGEPREQPWLALFVPPPAASAMAAYHLFLAPEDWAAIYKNALDGRAIGDTILDSWDATVPALFASGDRAFDVRVRFQGSQWQRVGGCDATATFGCEKPADFLPARLLSFRIGFPKYDQFRGRKALILNKQHDWGTTADFRFHGLQARTGFRLFQAAGVAAPDTRFARLRVNGCDFHIALEIERPDEEFLAARFQSEGDLFKANGCPRDVLWGGCGGPFDWADGRPLGPRGLWTADEVYAWNYERKTRPYDSHAALRALIEELDAAAHDPAQLRQALQRNFAVRDTLACFAAGNWSCVWDDAWQNYYLHRSGDDGLWRVFPWDMDQCLGGPSCCANVSATASVWRGRSDCADNWELDPGVFAWNRFKDYFLRAFPDEYLFHLCALNETACAPQALEARARADAAELRAELAHTLLPLTPEKLEASETALVDFVRARHAYVETIFIPRVDPGPPVLAIAGEEVVLDAAASDPPPGPDVLYVWSNGMTGAAPAVTFQEPGTYELALTITRTLRLGEETAQVARSAATWVRVVPAPVCYFPSAGSTVVFEAESNHALHPGTGDFAAYRWEPAVDQAASGGAAVRAEGPARIEREPYAVSAPELDYRVEIEWPPGPRTLWLRVRTGAAARRCYIGADGEAPPLDAPVTLPATGDEFAWHATTVVFKAPGRALLSAWLADPDLAIDKLVLTADPGFTPAGAGPPEQPARCGLNVFVRGDANRDGRLDIADAIAILSYLFSQSPTVACGDHADANDDGSLNIGDPIYVLQHLFARGPAPPRPYPAPGLDATPSDAFTCGD